MQCPYIDLLVNRSAGHVFPVLQALPASNRLVIGGSAKELLLVSLP